MVCGSECRGFESHLPPKQKITRIQYNMYSRLFLFYKLLFQNVTIYLWVTKMDAS